jgi:hypothetical protein
MQNTTRTGFGFPGTVPNLNTQNSIAQSDFNKFSKSIHDSHFEGNHHDTSGNESGLRKVPIL